MKSKLWAGLIVVACSAGIGAAAQTAGQTDPSRSSSQSAANQITVTGCVQRGGATSGATGTSGTTGAATSTDANFILANAMIAGSAGAHAETGAATTGAATTGTSGAASTYRLDADASKLSAHVGHKVEITGTLDKSAMSSSPSTATGTTPPASSTMSSNQPKLKVDTVRMIAASCTE
jgi:hypothetical protein